MRYYTPLWFFGNKNEYSIKIVFWSVITLLTFLSLLECFCGFVVYVVGKLNHL